jgi:hypothetical protein
MEPFGDSQPSRIESQDYSPVLDIGDTCHDPSHLVSGENDGECFRSLTEWDMSHYPVTLAGDAVEELQSTYGLVELAPRGVQFVDHPKLEVANLLWPKFFGMLAKPHRESIDVVGVGVDSSGGEVSELHVFSHAFGEGSDTLFVRSHE